MFCSPSSGSTPETYSENAVLGDRIMIFEASSTSRWRYIRNAARCMATEVLPDPAPPTTETTRAVCWRMAAFCSACMVATIWRM